MRFFTRAFVVLLLMTFANYVLQAEADAMSDPIGASVRAVARLASSCYRNQGECEAVKSVATTVYRAGEIGVGLATGQGKLVYVPQDQPSRWSGGGPFGGAGGIMDLLAGEPGPGAWPGGAPHPRQ